MRYIKIYDDWESDHCSEKLNESIADESFIENVEDVISVQSMYAKTDPCSPIKNSKPSPRNINIQS